MIFTIFHIASDNKTQSTRYWLAMGVENRDSYLRAKRDPRYLAAFNQAVEIAKKNAEKKRRVFANTGFLPYLCTANGTGLWPTHNTAQPKTESCTTIGQKMHNNRPEAALCNAIPKRLQREKPTPSPFPGEGRKVTRGHPQRDLSLIV